MSLNDYQFKTPRRVYTVDHRPLGPLQTPIAPQQDVLKGVDATNDKLDRIIKLLELLPFTIMREFRKSYLEGGRDQQSFIRTSQGEISLAAAATAVIASFTVQPNFEGALRSIGMNVVPTASGTDVSWSLRINGITLHPGFTNIQLSSSTLSNPIEFDGELLQGRLYELIATNGGATPVDVQGIMTGYTAFIGDWKTWGSKPESGIS